MVEWSGRIMGGHACIWWTNFKRVRIKGEVERRERVRVGERKGDRGGRECDRETH